DSGVRAPAHFAFASEYDAADAETVEDASRERLILVMKADVHTLDDRGGEQVADDMQGAFEMCVTGLQKKESGKTKHCRRTLFARAFKLPVGGKSSKFVLNLIAGEFE